MITLALVPFMIGGNIINVLFSMGFSDKTDKAFKDSANIVTDAVLNIRTIYGFNMQKQF